MTFKTKEKMSIKSKHISAAIAIMAAANVSAQMNNVIEVENEYAPIVADANKINVLPDVEETKVNPGNIEYATTPQPVRKYIFQPMWAAQSDATVKGAKKGFAELGYGNYNNLIGRAAYGIDFTTDDQLDINFGINGFNGTFDNFDQTSEWKRRFYDTSAGIKYEHRFSHTSSLIVDAHYRNQAFNYQPYSIACDPTDKQVNRMGGINVGITPYNFGAFSIGGGLGFEAFSQAHANYASDNCDETIIKAKLLLGYQLNDDMSIDLGIDVHNAGYTNEDFTDYTSFNIASHFNLEKEKFSLKAGLQIYATSGFSSDFYISPDVSFAYMPSKKTKLYVKAEGGAVYNNFLRYNATTPYWLNYNQEKNQFDQLRSAVGIKFTPAKGLYFDINGGFDMSKNRMELCLSNWTGPVSQAPLYNDIVTSDGSRFHINADIKYRYKDIFELSFANRLNFWSTEGNNYAEEVVLGWRPVIDLDWNAYVRIVEGLRFGLSYQCQSFKEYDDAYYNRPTTNNLGAELSYTFPFNLTIFVKGDNLLNQDYDHYMYYKAEGINFIGGAAITF